MCRSGKKPLNVDSPSFTPSNQQQNVKRSTFSSQAASAAPFTPRVANASTSSLQQNVEAPVFNPATIKEFTPQTQNYDLANSTLSNGAAQDTGYLLDQFGMGSVAQALPAVPVLPTLPTLPALPQAGQYNPYANDHSGMAGTGATYFQPHAYPVLMLPPLYHLYCPIGPYREDLLPHQRAAHDFFLPVELREDLQKKAYTTLVTLQNNNLPTLEKYHSLFPLDTNVGGSNQKNATTAFGYPGWVFKAKSAKNGGYYCLRRIEGFRLTNEHAMRPAREWKKITNANVVRVHEAFTTREFGDSSLIFSHDYHPLSKTLAEHHFPNFNFDPSFNRGTRHRGPPPPFIPENILWAYICQIVNALVTIHSAKLAARCVELSKIILTKKNHIRLAACAVLDVVRYETDQRPMVELQEEDLVQFGKLILALATSSPLINMVNIGVTLESLTTKYSGQLRDAVAWLVSDAQPGNPKTIEHFMSGITSQLTNYMDAAFHEADVLTSHLQRELENGRIVRLLCKLGTINERGAFANDPAWSENGERYHLKLFRDYVFHQCDQEGKPVLDLGHMLSAIAKLDAGAEEKIMLCSRDEENVFVISFRELKLMFDRTFNELLKHSI